MDGGPEDPHPYIQNFNLNVEQAIGKAMALQVGYVGSAEEAVPLSRPEPGDPTTGNLPSGLQHHQSV